MSINKLVNNRPVLLGRGHWFLAVGHAACCVQQPSRFRQRDVRARFCALRERACTHKNGSNAIGLLR